MTIRVRKAIQKDRDVLVDFNCLMADETENKQLDHDTVTAGVQASLDDPSKGFYLVVEADRAIAGGLMITTEWSDWRNGYFWWIQSVYVRPEFRRQGIYAMLHAEVEEMARDRGDIRGLRLYVDRQNARAKATYERLGMTIDRYDFYWRELPRTDAN